MIKYSTWTALFAASTLLSPALTGAASAQALQFNTHKDYTAGSGPASVAVGDMNGDGVPDLAIANYGDNTVAVLLGNGDGTFRPVPGLPVYLGSGAQPRSVAVGDFNRDGRLDVVVANPGANTVSVLLGNGDGTLQAPTTSTTLTAGSSPASVAVGDFNGDGKLDLAVANTVSSSISILLGNGDGTFQAAQFFGTDSGPAFVALGDFNRDGKIDLAVANTSAGTVSVLLGNGNGTFQAARNTAAGTAPSAVAVGDLNGDGAPDLAISDVASGLVSVLLGKGDGTFQPAQTFPAGGNAAMVVIGDFNGDHHADLALATTGPLVAASVLLGNGDGTFAAVRSFAVGSTPWGIAAGDFNADGAQDLVVTNTFSSSVSVLLGKGDGTFPSTPTYGVGPSPQSVAVGDFNHDGKLDMAVSNAGTTTPYVAYGVSMLLGNGDGTFQPARAVDVGTAAPISLAVGDFNRDGNLDLAVATYGNTDHQYNSSAGTTIAVLLGNGDGTFQPPRTLTAGSGPFFVAAGDFNGDGVSDLVVADLGPSTQRSNTISVFLGNGDGTFKPAVPFTVDSAPTWVVVADFNGDGKVDLAVANDQANTVSVLLGNGDGTFQAAHGFGAGSSPWGLAVGDFNGDGRPDLAVASEGYGGVMVLLGNGDGTFQPARFFATDRGALAASVGDFNGDGKQDLAVANLGSTTVSVLLGNGDGTFQAAQNFGAGTAPDFVAVADVNGDGKPDLVVANYFGNTVSVLINTTGGVVATDTLAVSKAGSGTGTVTSSPAGIDCGAMCSASYNNGTVVTLTAQADTSSTFSSWSGCDSASGTTCTVTMNAARSVTATFTANVPRFTLTVSKGGAGSGTVTSTSNPNSATQINCGTACSATYDSGTVVTLTAQADTSSTFSSWTGCDSASGPTCTVTMNAARSVTATFTTQAFTLAVNKAGNGSGTVTSSPSGINCGAACSASFNGGTMVTLTATAAGNSIFGGWNGCDGVSGPTCTVTMNAARSVTATFTLPQFNLAVSKAGSGSGTVTSSPSGIDCGAACSASFNSGTMVTLTATAAGNSIFGGWSGCDGVSGPTCTVTMNAARSVTATFTLPQFTLAVSKTSTLGLGSGTVTSSPAGINCGSICSASYVSGTTVVLTATPDLLSGVAGWTGCDSSTATTCTVDVNAAKAVTVRFALLGLL
jgi:hypothetical protein